MADALGTRGGSGAERRSGPASTGCPSPLPARPPLSQDSPSLFPCSVLGMPQHPAPPGLARCPLLPPGCNKTVTGGTMPGRARSCPAATGTEPGHGVPQRLCLSLSPRPSPKPLIHLSQQEMPKLPFHAGSSARELAALSIPGAGRRCVGQAGGIPPLPRRSRCA